MAYLTLAEYTTLTGNTMEQAEFDRLLPRASEIIDVNTRRFYQFTDLETDNVFRSGQFKKAVAFQIEFMDEIGAVNNSQATEPQSWSVGRTSVSNGSSNSDGDKTNNILSTDAIMALSGTGLLYRGIC